MSKPLPLKIGKEVFAFTRPYVMGILNVTPDSFSDGGLFLKEKEALDQAERLIRDGADLIDIGAQSTKPGSPWISVEEEWSRLEPVLKVYKSRFSTPISVDTVQAEVARRALALGADMINDVSAGYHDPEMARCVAEFQVPMVLMHMQGSPMTMQQNPTYTSVTQEVAEFLKQAAENVCAEGVSQVILDPGIGFGKKVAHNLALLHQLDQLTQLDRPVLVGVSRKSFIGDLTGDAVQDRLEGTLAACVVALQRGAHIFRVHDVRAVCKALKVAHEILSLEV